jgi:hypothetical protein
VAQGGPGLGVGFPSSPGFGAGFPIPPGFGAGPPILEVSVSGFPRFQVLGPRFLCSCLP